MTFFEGVDVLFYMPLARKFLNENTTKALMMP